jgi:hypothetical protein
MGQYLFHEDDALLWGGTSETKACAVVFRSGSRWALEIINPMRSAPEFKVQYPPIRKFAAWLDMVEFRRLLRYIPDPVATRRAGVDDVALFVFVLQPGIEWCREPHLLVVVGVLVGGRAPKESRVIFVTPISNLNFASTLKANFINR